MVAEKIVTCLGMGDPAPGSAYQHEFGLDEGNALGYVMICIWPARKTPGLNERRIALRDRLAKFVEEDEECQRILREEKELKRDD